MTTPALNTVVPGSAPGHGHGVASTKHTDDSRSFESVLSDHPKAPGAPAGQGKPGVATARGEKHDPTKDAAGGTTKQDGQQALPQAALYIAAQASAALPAQGKLDGTPATAEPANAIKAAGAATEAASVGRATKGGTHKDSNALMASALATTGHVDGDTATPAHSTQATAVATTSETDGTALAAAHAASANAHTRAGSGKHDTAARLAAVGHGTAVQNTTPEKLSVAATTGAGSNTAIQAPVHPEAALAITKDALPRGKQHGATHGDLGAGGLSATQTVFTPTSATTATTGSVAQPGVSAPLQSPQWTGQFARQFVSLTHMAHPSGSHSAQLRLDPPNLGPLHVSISINDNIAHAVFTSPHAAVRHAVENALPQLQQQLAQSGISLGQTSVNDQGARHDSPADGFSARKPRAAQAIGGVDGGIGATVTAPTAKARAPRPNVIVDTFA